MAHQLHQQHQQPPNSKGLPIKGVLSKILTHARRTLDAFSLRKHSEIGREASNNSPVHAAPLEAGTQPGNLHVLHCSDVESCRHMFPQASAVHLSPDLVQQSTVHEQCSNSFLLFQT